MTNDFAAAHSADTYWFAVEAAGHIGFFETGESGTLPKPCRNFDAIGETLRSHGVVEPQLRARRC